MTRKATAGLMPGRRKNQTEVFMIVSPPRPAVHNPDECRRLRCARCAELCILDEPADPIDPLDEAELLAGDPDLAATRARNPCRGHPCPADPCDRCRAWWTLCRLLMHRRQRAFEDRERLAPMLADLRRIAEVYPHALAELLTPIIVPIIAHLAREASHAA